jgi:acyl-CoA thioesterase
MTATGFDEVLAGLALEGGRGTVEVPEGWGQGRATLGGLVAALALSAMRGVVAEPRPPRSLLSIFTGPVEPGAVEVEVGRLRRGGSVTHAEARLVQGGEVRCAAFGAFGAGRDSALEVAPPPRPAAPGPEGLDELPFVAGVTPEFTRHVAYRWALGAPVFSGAGRREMGGWCRLRDGLGAASEERLLALVDAWPAAVLSRIDRPAPASSLTWAIEFVHPPAPAAPAQPAAPPAPAADQWWFYRSETEAAAGGYAHESAALWDPTGRLVALSRQAVAVFA